MQIYEFSKEAKKLAVLSVNSAVKRGDLISPDSCEICHYDLEMLSEMKWEQTDMAFFSKNDVGGSHLIAAHHFNYNHPLKVWWLCVKCHSVLHALQRKHKLACITLDGARELINSNRDFYNKYVEIETPRYTQEEFF